MTVIGIDTATRLGGVAVVSGGRLLGAHVLGVEEGHSSNLLPVLEGLMRSLGLARADVDGIAVAVGPGSYTGLRIGVAVAKGLGYAWGVPVRGVSTLMALAWPFRGVDGAVCAALDARKGHVFSAIYRGRLLDDGGEEACAGAVLEPEDRRSLRQVAQAIDGYLAQGNDVYLVGDGAPYVVQERAGGESAGTGKGPRLVVASLLGEAMRAACVAHIGELELSKGLADDVFSLSPNYLRRSEAERRWRQSR